MTQPLPSDREQVRFLHGIQRILSEGSFVATYKFALLHALADLSVTHASVEDPGGPLELKTRDIAERFVELYWLQARPYHTMPDGRDAIPRVLRQNTDRQALIVRLVGDLREVSAGSLEHARRTPHWQRIVAKVDANVREQPLWKLQVIAGKPEDLLYDNVMSGTSITLHPGVAFCFRSFYGLVTDLVRGAWLLYLRRFNVDVFNDTEDLHTFLFGREREPLDAYRDLLLDVHHGTCFYCQKPLKIDAFDVDHFIPWSRSPLDLGHNFVPAHKTCNSQKSDHIPAEEHLESWCRRNADHGHEIASFCDENALRQDVGISIRIARSAYEAVAAQGGRVWHAGREFGPIRDRWRGLLVAA